MLDEDFRDEEGRLLPDPPYEIEVNRCAPCELIEEAKEELKEADTAGLQLRFRKARPHPGDE